MTQTHHTKLYKYNDDYFFLFLVFEWLTNCQRSGSWAYTDLHFLVGNCFGANRCRNIKKLFNGSKHRFFTILCLLLFRWYGAPVATNATLFTLFNYYIKCQRKLITIAQSNALLKSIYRICYRQEISRTLTLTFINHQSIEKKF